MEEEMPIEEAVPKFCLFFAETVLQLLNTKRREKVKDIIRLVLDANFDAEELCRHVKRTDGCKPVLNDIKGEELAEESFKKKIVKIGSLSSVLGAVLHKKDFLALLRRQAAMSSSQVVFSSSQHVPEGTVHAFGTLHGQSTQRKVSDRVTASGSRERWWSSETFQLPRFFAGFIQIYSGKTPRSLEFDASVSDPAHLL